MKKIVIKTDRAVEIFRDLHGVPHVHAEFWHDALYGLGYMHGLDRGTQLLFSRSVASGRAGEEISATPELLETDRFFRRIGLPRDLHHELESFDDWLRNDLANYCAGVNDGLAGLGRTWPMWATNYQPRPWDPAAVLLIGKLLSFGGLAISQMQNERLLLELIHAGVNDEAMRELFSPHLDGVDFELLRRVQIANRLSDEALELLSDLPRLAGSNAWAVAPERSATGTALLASDPHLEVNRLPAIWYEAVIRWHRLQPESPARDDYVLGATLPGCPLFAVARNRHLAWGVTYMKGDTVDSFVEDVRAGGANGWQYRREERWCDFQIREEVIHHKGGGHELLPVYENEQGILEAAPEELGEGLHLSIAWSGNYAGNGRAIGAWLKTLVVDNVAEAMDVVRDCEQPTLCWVFADRDGHIGMQGCGRFPRRGNGYSGLTPIPAWDPRNHWRGWLPKTLLPCSYDPPEGFVATANEDLNHPKGPWLITQPLPDYRKRRIVERLRQLPEATVADMQALQYDLVSPHARDLLAVFLPHLPAALKDRLGNWDCRFTTKSTEATLFMKLYLSVIIEILGHEQGIGWRRMVYLCSRAGYSVMVLTGADRLLLQSDSVWWRGRDKGELIRRAAERIDPEQPPWSKINTFHFTDRFFGNHQVGKLLGYKSRQYSMPGSHATPFQGHVLQTATRESTFAPSYHFVTDTGEDLAWTNLPGGPTENRFSRFYKSDVERWLSAQYKSLEIQPRGSDKP